MAGQTFAELQAQFRSIWPAVTLRSIGDVERTVVVVHSISMDIPDQLIPISPAYEERFLCLVLSLLRAPRSRVVYVTSQPIHPRVADYYFSLVPELDTPEARSRFETVSLVDGRKEPLSRKLLTRPGAVERVRRLIGEPEVAMIIPFCMTADEVGLAEALAEIRGRSPSATSVVLKLDLGVSGLGNALLDLAAAERDLEAAIELEDEEIDVEQYLALLDHQGGIVEQRIEGDDFRSPSVQLRMSPAGQVDIMSTHDQVLGGPHGQTYFGCHFPADPEYAAQIAAEGLKIGRRLAREGAIGRASVDFVAVRQGARWDSYALEINLRCGGTTH